MPAQQPVPTSYKGPYQPTLPDQRVYSSIKAFPDTLSRHLSTQSKHGYRIAIITLNPVEHIPAKGEISYYKSMDLIVRTKWAGGDINKFFRANDKDRQEVRNIVDNPEAVDT